MIVKVYYTYNYFSHFDNDYNNTFTVPHEDNQITWSELTNPRVKWIDNDRAELVVNNQVSGNMLGAAPNFKKVSRIKITKQRSEASENQYGNYIYFVKEVIRQLDGGCIVELELDYWLTYLDLSPFGNVGNFLLEAPDQLIIDRSHLMPEPSSWLATTEAGYTYINNWPQYNSLLSTLERLPFDISKSVDKLIYHNQNFLMCAPGYLDSCGLVDTAYPDTYYSMVSSQVTSIKLTWAMPFKNNATHDYHLGFSLVFNNINPAITLDVPVSIVTQLVKDLKESFNTTTLFLCIPYNVEATTRTANATTLQFNALNYSNKHEPKFLIVPAPVGSAAYQMYVSGKLASVGVFLIDMPLPNILGLINNNWNRPPYAIYDSDNKVGLGLAAIQDFVINNDIYKQFLLGFTIKNSDLNLSAEYLIEGITDDRDLYFKMIDDRYNRKPTLCSWGEFLNGYTPNLSTNDLYILKGLNNIYFNFKSGFIQYNFQDYESQASSVNSNKLGNLEFRINLFGWSFGLQTKGFIKLNDNNSYNNSFYNNATTPWFYSNATRTSNYSQWISPLIFNNAYYEFMNTQNNSFNTSLKQMRWNHLTNLIAPGFSAAAGTAGTAYSALTGAFGKVGMLGAAGMAISGGLSLIKTMANNYFDVEKKNSFLADLNATHNGFTNATGNYNLDVLPSMLQVVINDYMACRIWNWINKYGYSVIDTFNARHINLSNLKPNKTMINNVITDNQKDTEVMKYGCIRFLSDNLAIINKAMYGAMVGKLFEVMPAKAINWMSGLYTHGISFCAFFK